MKNQKIAIFITIAAILGVIVFFNFFFKGFSFTDFKRPNGNQSESISQLDRRLEFTDLDGKIHRLDEFGKKPILISFFATWCAPCIREIPEFDSLFLDYGNSLTVIGISVDQNRLAVPMFVKDQQIRYPVGFGSDRLFEKFGTVSAIPAIYLFDKNGKLVDHWVGYNPDKIKAIPKLLGLQ